MGDQAETLRKLAGAAPAPAGEPKKDTTERSAKVITVTSGKGGVGKTNMTINLGIALSRMGLRVVILDADFGLANIDVLFGVVPQHTLVDLFRDECSIFDVLTNGPENVKFLSGGSGVEELVRLDNRQLKKFVSNIGLLDKLYDIILIDTGAGLSRNVMSFIMAADEVVLVTTPEPTAVTDAYALIKMVSRRDRKKPIRVLVNRVESKNEAEDIMNRLATVSEKFLSLKLLKLGYIVYDESVVRAVKQQKPFLIGFPRALASRQITDLAAGLLHVEEQETTEAARGAKGFFQRLISYFGTPA
jgi:flagellar biosynthesis protein FlhG